MVPRVRRHRQRRQLEDRKRREVQFHIPPSDNMSYLLAINCGSSSIKGKLYHLPKSKDEPLNDAASLSVSNISSKGEKIKIKIQWKGEEGKDVNEEGEDGGDVECELARR
jgi:hypothetical protein